MDQQGRDDFAPPPITTQPIRQPRQSSWPLVIGIICCVIGGMGILTYAVCGTLGSIFQPFFTDLAYQATADTTDGQAMAAAMERAEQYRIPALVLNLLLAAVAVLLLVGGIALIKRRSNARKLLNIWAVMRIVMAVPAVILGYYQSQAQLEIMQASDSGTPMPLSADFAAAMGGVGVGISLMWAILLPTFILIWMNREKIVAEMRQW